MKLFSALTAGVFILAMSITGCKTLPSEEVIRGTAESIGRAAGYAVELSKTKDEVKDAIIKVLDVASAVVPETNQTFIAAWKPLIDAEIDKLIAAGKLREDDGALAKSALYVACDGIDLVFSRYPKAKAYQNLVSAATSGFVTGFKSIVRIADGARMNYDEEAYKILRAKFESK